MAVHWLELNLVNRSSLDNTFANTLECIFLLLVSGEREKILIDAVSRSTVTIVVERQIEASHTCRMGSPSNSKYLPFFQYRPLTESSFFAVPFVPGITEYVQYSSRNNLPSFAPHCPMHLLLVDKLVPGLLFSILIFGNPRHDLRRRRVRHIRLGETGKCEQR